MTSGKTGGAKSAFVRFADSVAGLNEQSMGDERESQVILRAYTFALVAGMSGLMVAGAVLSMFGYWGFALGAMLFGALQGYLAIAYSAASNVSLYALEAHTSQRRKLISGILFTVVLLVFFGARGYEIYVGRPLLGGAESSGAGHVPESDFWSMLAGAACGLIFVFSAKAIMSRRRKLDPAEVEDED